MPSERFDFPNARGEKLSALLDKPAGQPVAFALFAHCFTCGKDNLAAKRIAEALTASGTAVLRLQIWSRPRITCARCIRRPQS